MKIAVDIDGVLGDILKVIVDYLYKVYGIKIKEEDITQYDFHELIGMNKEEYKKMFLNYRLYLNEPLIPGCKEGLESLKDLGYEITLVTARDYSLCDTTLKWLDKNRLPFDRLIFVDGKSKKEIAEEYEFYAFIEDKYETCVELGGSVTYTYLIDTLYNQGEFDSSIIRVKTWNEIIDREYSTHYMKQEDF